MESKSILEAALKNAYRALNILEEKAAAYGSLEIPVSLQIELEDKRAEVAELEARLRGSTPLKITQKPTHPDAPPARNANSTGDIHADGPAAAVVHGAAATVTHVTHIGSVAGPVHTGSGDITMEQPGAGTRSQSQVDVLFLAANPKDTPRLRLEEEIRAIDLALRQSQYRERFDIHQHWAVRVSEIRSLLLRYQPHIVHFSGHGSQSSQIVLEDAQGRGQVVQAKSLSRLFLALKDNIRCVVLNACYSQGQAEAIAEHIDCVIGMSRRIGDQAAVSFASSFYQALGYGRDIYTAFELGCLEIDLENLADADAPRLIANRVDPRKIYLIQPG